MTWRANKTQFPKMSVSKPRKYGSRIYIDPSDFILMRHRAFLTTQATAELLDVTHRTVINWEKGETRIPYTAYRVLKLKVGYVFDDEHFGDWFVRGDTLWSPEGRGFKPYELRFIAHYFWMARKWLAERQVDNPQNHLDVNIPAGVASDGSPVLSNDSTGTLPSCGAVPLREFSNRKTRGL